MFSSKLINYTKALLDFFFELPIVRFFTLLQNSFKKLEIYLVRMANFFQVIRQEQNGPPKKSQEEPSIHINHLTLEEKKPLSIFSDRIYPSLLYAWYEDTMGLRSEKKCNLEKPYCLPPRLKSKFYEIFLIQRPCKGLPVQ